MAMREEHFLDPRRAGEVLCLYDIPAHHTQTIGERSWQVLRILLAIWPDAPSYMIKHCIVRDVGKISVSEIAHLTMAKPWDLPPPQQLSGYEHQVFQLAQQIETLEWALEERNLGNNYAAGIEARVRAEIEKLTHALSLTGTHTELLLRASRYRDKRVDVEKEIGG